MLINPQKDRRLDAIKVRVYNSACDPSIHYVSSYVVEETQYHYHVFKWITGLSVVDYNKQEYDQLKKFIDISDRWAIYYDDGEFPLFQVSDENRWIS
ncbi:hypothetical protein GCM10025859_17040 [Alicyclobacillus fastidiosus]|nr:hypothetical protein GCM10025859_17040 [Alicyclobacillus fastidiosus]